MRTAGRKIDAVFISAKGESEALAEDVSSGVGRSVVSMDPPTPGKSGSGGCPFEGAASQKLHHRGILKLMGANSICFGTTYSSLFCVASIQTHITTIGMDREMTTEPCGQVQARKKLAVFHVANYQELDQPRGPVVVWCNPNAAYYESRLRLLKPSEIPRRIKQHAIDPMFFCIPKWEMVFGIIYIYVYVYLDLCLPV